MSLRNTVRGFLRGAGSVPAATHLFQPSRSGNTLETNNVLRLIPLAPPGATFETERHGSSVRDPLLGMGKPWSDSQSLFFPDDCPGDGFLGSPPSAIVIPNPCTGRPWVNSPCIIPFNSSSRLLTVRVFLNLLTSSQTSP